LTGSSNYCNTLADISNKDEMMRKPNFYNIVKSIHVPALFVVIGVLFFIILRLFFFCLDKGIVKSNDWIKHEQEGLTSLEVFVNESIKNCHMSVADFERLVHIHYGAKIHWKDDSGFAGELRVTKKDFCIEEIRYAK